jgi:hypothetical protein
LESERKRFHENPLPPYLYGLYLEDVPK